MAQCRLHQRDVLGVLCPNWCDNRDHGIHMIQQKLEDLVMSLWNLPESGLQK